MKMLISASFSGVVWCAPRFAPSKFCLLAVTSTKLEHQRNRLTMDNSPFARLSPELRNHIYEFTLRSQYPQIDFRDIVLFNGLTRTCSQIRCETRTLFYAVNNFAIHGIPMKQLEKFLAFLRQLGPEALSQMMSLRFRIINIIPCPGARPQRSHWVEVRGGRDVDDVNETYWPIKTPIPPKEGVEMLVFSAFENMGLQVSGREQIWSDREGEDRFVGAGRRWRVSLV